MELTQYENAEFIYIVRFKKVGGEDANYREMTGKLL